jgi:hypothetical protein
MPCSRDSASGSNPAEERAAGRLSSGFLRRRERLQKGIANGFYFAIRYCNVEERGKYAPPDSLQELTFAQCSQIRGLSHEAALEGGAIRWDHPGQLPDAPCLPANVLT